MPWLASLHFVDTAPQVRENIIVPSRAAGGTIRVKYVLLPSDLCRKIQSPGVGHESDSTRGNMREDGVDGFLSALTVLVTLRFDTAYETRPFGIGDSRSLDREGRTPRFCQPERCQSTVTSFQT